MVALGVGGHEIAETAEDCRERNGSEVKKPRVLWGILWLFLLDFQWGTAHGLAQFADGLAGWLDGTSRSQHGAGGWLHESGKSAIIPAFRKCTENATSKKETLHCVD